MAKGSVLRCKYCQKWMSVALLPTIQSILARFFSLRITDSLSRIWFVLKFPCRLKARTVYQTQLGTWDKHCLFFWVFKSIWSITCACKELSLATKQSPSTQDIYNLPQPDQTLPTRRTFLLSLLSVLNLLISFQIELLAWVVSTQVS